MKAKEKAIREAAEVLRDAIVAGEASGLHVGWPARRVEDLMSLEISETGKASVVIATDTTRVDPETASKAGTAAQKAATKVVESAK